MKMREININIEGYNVNGICIGCLNYNRKMCHKDEIGVFLKLLCDIEVPLGISLQVCWECNAHLTNVKRFQNQMLKSYYVLLDYSKQQTFLNCPTDFTKHAANRLSVHKIKTNDIYVRHGSLQCTENDDHVGSNGLKSEFEGDAVNFGHDVKPELEDTESGVNGISDYEDPIKSETDVKDETDSSDKLVNLVPGEKKTKMAATKRKKKLRKKLKSSTQTFLKHAANRSSALKINTNDIYIRHGTLQCADNDDHVGSNGLKSEFEGDCGNFGHDCEDPIKSETDLKNETELVNSVPRERKSKMAATKQQKKLRKKLKSSTSKNKKLQSNIKSAKSVEDLVKGAEELRSKMDFVYAVHKCDYCLLTFDSKEDCDSHNDLKHIENGGYSCSLCKIVFANRILYEDHTRTHFTRSEDRDKPPSHKRRIKCPLCERTFSHRAGLMNHRMAMHEGKVEYPCGVCSKVFRWKNSLKRHMERHDQRAMAAAPAAYCETCHIAFSYICSYQRHLRSSLKHVSHDQLRFICDHCGRKFADKTKLRYHIEEKHLHKTYHCDICFKPSKNRSHLEQHVRNVHVGRPNNKMCNHCGKGFPTKVQLESHLRTHTGERPFICELCPTTFTQQSNLYKHRRQVHLNIKSKRYPTQKKKKEDVNQPATDQFQMTWA